MKAIVPSCKTSRFILAVPVLLLKNIFGLFDGKDPEGDRKISLVLNAPTTSSKARGDVVFIPTFELSSHIFPVDKVVAAVNLAT